MVACGMDTDDFVAFVLDQLAGLPDVRHRRMFGGTGLYQGELFFAIVDRGRLYFRTDDAGRVEFERRGMAPFAPNPRQVLKNYYEVPVDVLEDDSLLCDWARRAVAAQERGSKRKGTR